MIALAKPCRPVFDGRLLTLTAEGGGSNRARAQDEYSALREPHWLALKRKAAEAPPVYPIPYWAALYRANEVRDAINRSFTPAPLERSPQAPDQPEPAPGPGPGEGRVVPAGPEIGETPAPSKTPAPAQPAAARSPSPTSGSQSKGRLIDIVI